MRRRCVECAQGYVVVYACLSSTPLRGGALMVTFVRAVDREADLYHRPDLFRPHHLRNAGEPAAGGEALALFEEQERQWREVVAE
jgi:hypothetical protein